MCRTLALAAVFPLLFSAETLPPVRSVRINGAPSHVNLATQVGQPFDAARISDDVHMLWRTGRFSDIRVRTEPDGDGTRVLFEVTSLHPQALHQLRVSPPVPGLQMKLAEGTPVDSIHAHEIAQQAEGRLRGLGYDDARVTYEWQRYLGNQFDLVLHPKIGDLVRIGSVRILGDAGLPPARLRAQLKQTRARRLLPPLPFLSNGWRLLPAYSQDAVESDLARLRSMYLAEGYYDAQVRLDSVDTDRHANVTILVRAGERHTPTPASKGVCTSLLAQRREAERQGVLDFSATLHVPDLTVAGNRGRPYRVGRIEFTGLHRQKDASVRRSLLLDEGRPMDEFLLRKSLAQINRSTLFEPLGAGDAGIRTNEKTGVADVTIHLVERKRGAWNLSGPVGPASVAGPLEASISTRAPHWSSYVLSLRLIAFSHPIVPALSVIPTGWLLPVAALSRPFTPAEGWKSGWMIAPQLGWKASAISYGVTQLQQRALARLSGGSDLTPDLPVRVEGSGDLGIMYCEAPKPRMHALRVGMAVSLRALGFVVGL